MNDILFEVLKAVIIIVVMLVARYGIPYIKLQLDNSKYKWIVDCVEQGVKFAEQTVIGEKTGAEKKAIVTEFIKKMLTKKNISISDEQINVLIESAVFAMNKAV